MQQPRFTILSSLESDVPLYYSVSWTMFLNFSANMDLLRFAEMYILIQWVQVEHDIPYFYMPLVVLLLSPHTLFFQQEHGWSISADSRILYNLFLLYNQLHSHTTTLKKLQTKNIQRLGV
jgi:hypothetical protein